jgi:hypothetical protein
VLPRQPPGVYIVLPGDEVNHTEEELAAMRAAVPTLRPSGVVTCPCDIVHTRAHQLAREGAVHGDRIRGAICLSCDDAAQLDTMLSGCRSWDVELIYDDSKVYGWVRSSRAAQSVCLLCDIVPACAC